MSTVWQNTTGALEFFPPPGWVGCCLPPAAAAALQLSPVARAPARVSREWPPFAPKPICASLVKSYLCKSDQVHCKKKLRQPPAYSGYYWWRWTTSLSPLLSPSGASVWSGVHLANFRQPFALLRSLFFFRNRQKFPF